MESPTPFRIIVPTRNGGERWVEAAHAIARSVGDPAHVVIIDSASVDNTPAIAAELGFTVRSISANDFNHGGTRQQAVDEFAGDSAVVIFLTQDAVLNDEHSLASLLKVFEDPQVACAFGRQVPHVGAGLFESHATNFNYGSASEDRNLADIPRLGIKTAYFSNSFAAYRVSKLIECGGFPRHLILGEDAYVAAQLLLAGHTIRYCAAATVRHSHNYSIREESQRYFDFGVMHAQIPQLLARFGAPEGEGIAYVFSELWFIATRNPLQLPNCVLRNIAKYITYRLGREYRRLPLWLVRRLSMTKVYWRAAKEWKDRNTSAGKQSAGKT
jgi:rhamnosyltransferase